MPDFRCPGCGHSWRSLDELKRDGGHVRHLGLALLAVCPVCGDKFGAGSGWYKTRVIDLRDKSDGHKTQIRART